MGLVTVLEASQLIVDSVDFSYVIGTWVIFMICDTVL